MSELVSIVYKPEDAEPTVGAYTRVPRKEAILRAGYGIEGDAKGGDGNRQLNIMSADTLRDLTGEGFQASPGRMGEQLILAGIAVDKLPAGTQIAIGAEACVELTEPRTGCAKFERHQGKARQDASGRLGMMARVIKGGPITVGDTVTIVTR